MEIIALETAGLEVGELPIQLHSFASRVRTASWCVDQMYYQGFIGGDLDGVWEFSHIGSLEQIVILQPRNLNKL